MLVCDDPHKIEEAGSDRLRESVLAWWDTTMATRINDPQSGAMVVVMQRVHEQDLAGHLLARGDWEHLCLPAEYEPNHPFRSVSDRRTRPGAPLAPGRFSEAELDRLKGSLGSSAAAGQLQQRPSPASGGIFRRAWWRYYEPHQQPRDFDRVVQSWDLTFTAGPTSDYVVGQVWGRSGAHSYLLRQVRERLEFTETLQAIRDMTSWIKRRFPRAHGHAILVEDAANAAAATSVLRRELPGVIPIRPRGDKVSRAHAASPQVEAGNVHLPGAANADGSDYDRARTPQWVQAFVDELATFPNAAHDDQVDAFTQALVRLSTPRSRPRVRVLWRGGQRRRTGLSFR